VGLCAACQVEANVQIDRKTKAKNKQKTKQKIEEFKI
jgi:hypothetical protein